MAQDLSPAGFLKDMENGTQRTRGRGKLPALALPLAGGCRIAAGRPYWGLQQLKQMQNLSGGSSSDQSGTSSADPGLAVSPKVQQEGEVLLKATLWVTEGLLYLTMTFIMMTTRTHPHQFLGFGRY